MAPLYVITNMIEDNGNSISRFKPGSPLRNFTLTLLLVFLIIAVWKIPLSNSAERTTKIVLAIIGTLLMISTELLYSFKKDGWFNTGSFRTWLRIHIFTGLAGPALILWHADFRFPGLGGIISYTVIVVVISGIIGRYIYRLIPRTIKGQARDVDDLKAEESRIESELHALLAEAPEQYRLIERIEHLNNYRKSLFSTLWRSTADYYRHRRRLHRQLARAGGEKLAVYRELEDLMTRRLLLERRIKALDASKDLLAKWNLFHKPLTIAMFALIGVHVLSVFYYGRFY